MESEDINTLSICFVSIYFRTGVMHGSSSTKTMRRTNVIYGKKRKTKAFRSLKIISNVL